MNEFLELVAEELMVEVEEVSPDSVLREFEDWDSLAALTLVSRIDEDYGVSVLGEELAKAGTVAALWALIEEKRA